MQMMNWKRAYLYINCCLPYQPTTKNQRGYEGRSGGASSGNTAAHLLMTKSLAGYVKAVLPRPPAGTCIYLWTDGEEVDCQSQLEFRSSSKTNKQTNKPNQR